jgi:NAD(P)H dehydrogenase (quinone)
MRCQIPAFLLREATGATGSAAAALLLDRGERVRAFVHREDDRSEALRKRGAEVVVGDLLDFDAVREALNGVNRAYFVHPIRPGLVQATAQFAQSALKAGVEGIVNMSQISARGDAKSHSAREHWLAEQVFDWSGLNVAHIRPTYFAEWLLYLAPMIRQGLMYAPFTTGRHAPIAGEDQGRVIVRILEDPGPHRGKVYPLYGPVELTHDEIAKAVGRVLGREITYQSMPIEKWAEVVAGALGRTAATQRRGVTLFRSRPDYRQARQRVPGAALARGRHRPHERGVRRDQRFRRKDRGTAPAHR